MVVVVVSYRRHAHSSILFISFHFFLCNGHFRYFVMLTIYDIYRDKPVWKHPVVLSAMSAQSARLGEVQSLATQYAAPPTALDFTKYKDSIKTNRDLVEQLEKFYKANITTVALAKESLSPEEKLEDEAFLQEVQTVSAQYAELIQMWEKEITLLEENKVSKTTTLAQLYEVYPEIAEELEDDMDDFNLIKDMGLPEK